MKCNDCGIKLIKKNSAFDKEFMTKNHSTRLCKECNKKYKDTSPLATELTSVLNSLLESK